MSNNIHIIDKNDDDYGDDDNIDLYEGEQMDIEDGIEQNSLDKMPRFLVLKFWFWVAVCSIFNGILFAIMRESDLLQWPRWFCYLPFFSFWFLDLILFLISIPLIIIVLLIRRPHMYELLPSARRQINSEFGWSMWFGTSQFTTGLLLLLLKWEITHNAILPWLFIFHPWVSLLCAVFLTWISRRSNDYFGGDDPIRFYDEEDPPASVLASRQMNDRDL